MRQPSPSFIRVRQASVLLVQLEDHELPVGFEHDVASLGLGLLRSRYAVPAMQRIVVARPRAVFVGPRVRPELLTGLESAARKSEAAVRQVTSDVDRQELLAWLVDVEFAAGERRVRARLLPKVGDGAA